MKTKTLLWFGAVLATACSHQSEAREPVSSGDRTTLAATSGKDTTVYRSQQRTEYRAVPSKKTVAKRDDSDGASESRAKSYLTAPGTHLDDSGNTISNPAPASNDVSDGSNGLGSGVSNAGSVEPSSTDQPYADRDQTLTQQIHRALMGDDSLSQNAKNVSIAVNDGKVTLRGTVDSQNERSTIDNFARRIAGERAVDNLIEVKP